MILFLAVPCNTRSREAAIDRLPEQLSGGQKQRVSIARALVGKPELVLFDEPLSNLDANLREDLGRDIRILSKRFGLTCINVTHDRREAQILSDHIALMKDGKVHQLGQPQDLFSKPIDLWAAKFLDAGNILPAHIFPASPDRSAEASHVLFPRGAFKVSLSDTDHKAVVLGSHFVEDHFEITAELDDHFVKIFSPTDIHGGEVIRFAIDHDTSTGHYL